MSYVFKLTVSDGSVPDVDFMDTSYGGVVDYKPEPPELGADSVTETAKVELRPGSTPSSAIKLSRINRMFTLARARKASGKGPRVFVLFEKANTTPYRAEIYDGKVAFTDELLKLDLINEWYQLVITWVHSPWWELNTETQIPMSNGNGGDTLTALTVYNHDTATAGVDNWVNISSSNTIAGEFDLETPVRLEITNTYSSGLSTKLL